MQTLEPRFLVAFSFSGDHRAYVRRVASELKSELGEEKVFFDEWYEHEILGSDMDVKLQRIYHDESLMVVADLSQSYADKPWTRSEWRVIRALDMEGDATRDEVHRLRLLNLRFDDGEVPGVWMNTGFADAREKGATEMAALIMKRLALLQGRTTKKSRKGKSRPKLFALKSLLGVLVLTAIFYSSWRIFFQRKLMIPAARFAVATQSVSPQNEQWHGDLTIEGAEQIAIKARGAWVVDNRVIGPSGGDSDALNDTFPFPEKRPFSLLVRYRSLGSLRIDAFSSDGGAIRVAGPNTISFNVNVPKAKRGDASGALTVIAEPIR